MNRALIVLLLVAGCTHRTEEKNKDGKDKDGKVALGKEEKEKKEGKKKALPKKALPKGQVDTNLGELLEGLPANARPQPNEVIKTDRTSAWCAKNLVGKQVYFVTQIKSQIEKARRKRKNENDLISVYCVSMSTSPMYLQFEMDTVEIGHDYMLPKCWSLGLRSFSPWPQDPADSLGSQHARGDFYFETVDADLAEKFDNLKPKEVRIVGRIDDRWLGGEAQLNELRIVERINGRIDERRLGEGAMYLALSNITFNGMPLPVPPKTPKK